MDKKITRREHQKGLTTLWAKKKALTKKNFVNYINKVHINKLKEVVPDKL